MTWIAVMDIVDSALVGNRDWDPYYLSELFSEDFYDFSNHWQSNMNDMELCEGC